MADILVPVKGHPYARDAFSAMLESLPGGHSFTLVEHPAVEAVLHPDFVHRFGAILFYDMPGIDFRVPEPPVFLTPPAAYQAHMEALLTAGMPLLFLHHALAGWPAWPRYGEIIGGHFLYLPGEVRGGMRPDSGYRHHVTHRVRPAAKHPILAGLAQGFTIEDELYLCEIFEDSVTPLLRSDHDFSSENFYSAAAAMRGAMFSNEGWTHEKGSNLIAWTRQERASQIVYIQCGDSEAAYANPGLRQLLGNALAWLLEAAG
jgi:hypothetical protein